MAALDAEPTSVRPARHGEGPVWDDGAGELLWVDTAAGEVRWGRVEPDGGVRDVAVRPVREPVGAVTPTTGMGWLLAAGGGFRHLYPNGDVRALLDVADEGGDRTRMNDGACDRAGRFFAGSMGLQEQQPGAGSLYRVDLDGTVSTALTGLTVSHGIAWSPGDDVVYLADSGARTVTAFDYDLDLGTLGRPRVLLEFADDEPGTPDGLAVDRGGHVWVALWGGGEVRRYTSGGVLEDVVRAPVTQTASCAWAGPRLDVLVISTSTQGLSPREKADQPDAGRLFTARVPDVVGQPAYPYRGPLRTLTQF